MLCNKLFDPKDYEKPEYRMVKDYFESWWRVLQIEGIKFTYSSLNRAWEYGHIFNNVDFANKSVLDLGTSISLVPLYMTRIFRSKVITFDQAFVQERTDLYLAAIPAIAVETQENGKPKIEEVRPGVGIVQGDLLKPLEFQSGIFDIVTSFSTIEHIGDPTVMIAEMKRVTKKGGHICITTDYMEGTDPREKSGMTYHPEQLHYLIEKFGIPLLGETDFTNVDITKEENQAIKGKYTFAALIFQNI